MIKYNNHLIPFWFLFLLPLVLKSQDMAYHQPMNLNADRQSNETEWNTFDAIRNALDLGIEDMRILAEHYKSQRQLERSAYWYRHMSDNGLTQEDRKNYSFVLMAIGQSDQAKGIAFSDEAEHKARSGKSVSAASYYTPSSQFEDLRIEVVKGLNSEHLDFCPIPFGEGLIFSSTRKGNKRPSHIKDVWSDHYFSDLFFSKKGHDGGFTKPKLLKGLVNKKFHEGASCFDPHEKRIYFSRNNDNGKNNADFVSLKIYSAQKVGNEWMDVVELPFNDDNYTTCHPSLSRDGKRLYFASDRPGGFGKMDLYVSEKISDQWSEPINLGSQVNGSGNEIFPYINALDVLYFSTDKASGLGGLDIYQSEQNIRGEWGIPAALVEPFNSAEDDFGYIEMSDGRSGFLTSDRNGGYGGDDIYQWTGKANIQVESDFSIECIVIDETNGHPIEGSSLYLNIDGQHFEFITDMEGNVILDLKSEQLLKFNASRIGYETTKLSLNSSNLAGRSRLEIPLKPLNTVSISMNIADARTKVEISDVIVKLYNRCTGEMQTFKTDERGSFNLAYACHCDYDLMFYKDGYKFDEMLLANHMADCNEVTTVLKHTLEPLSSANTTLPKSRASSKPKPYEAGEVVILENIYYDFNKYNIRGDARPTLNELARVLKQHPEMQIELSSHTDCRGRSHDNQTLSQQRARAAKEYLFEQGIDPVRVIAVGYGESKLLNKCDDGVDCPEDMHQANRRTEVKILKMGNSEGIKILYE